MKDAARIGRIGVLAVGLGIGAAVASTPGTASADSFLPPFDPNDFAISIDGMTLFQVGTATAISGLGDFAIADGAHSSAVAEGGFGDFASAYGEDSTALAGDNALGASGNNFDSASAAGQFSEALAGDNAAHATGSNLDSASAAGQFSEAGAGFNGSFDSARAIGDGVGSVAGNDGHAAIPANFDFASALGSLTTFTTNSTVVDAVAGNNDVAFVLDPFGSIGSQALVGDGGNFDLAGAFGDNLSAISILNDFLVHIAPFF